MTIGIEAKAIRPEDDFFGGGDGAAACNLWTGSALESLVPVEILARSSGQVTFSAVRGTTYQIQADGRPGFDGALVLNLARTTPPLVQQTLPLENVEFRVSDPVDTAVEAFDVDGRVETVEFSLVEQSARSLRSATADTPPFHVVWTNLPPGRYTLKARATDNLGARADTFPLSFNVRPDNDRFSGRVPFSGSFNTVTGTLSNASSEPGDPAGIGRRNIWWSWTAPESGTFTITAISVPFRGMFPIAVPGFDPTLTIFTGGNLDGLTRVALSNSDGLDGTYSSRVVITAQAGTTYPIAVGTDGDAGESSLSVVRTAPPIVCLISPERDASFVIGEPVTFSAAADDADGTVRRVEFILDDYLSLGIMTTRPFTLVRTFTTEAFRHRVRAWATDDVGVTTVSEEVRFEIRYPGPANDNFADRIAFSGTFGTVTGSTANATYEPGERVLTSHGSAWWEWTAPESGPYTITVRANSGGWPSVAVFTGTSLASLQWITNNAYGGSDGTASTRVVVNALAGATYPIAVGDANTVSLSVAKSLPPSVRILSPTNNTEFVYGETLRFEADASDPEGPVSRVEFLNHSGEGNSLGVVSNSPFVLLVSTTNLFQGFNWLRARVTDGDGVSTVSEGVTIVVRPPGPTNDHFADRIAFTGLFIAVTGATANATFEAEEGRDVRDGSVWWSWTAPESGDFTITVETEPAYWPSLAVFTGSTLATLHLEAAAAFAGEDSTYSTRVVLRAQAGATYPIAVASRGNVRLSVLRGVPPSVVITSPTNDAFIPVVQVFPPCSAAGSLKRPRTWSSGSRSPRERARMASWNSWTRTPGTIPTVSIVPWRGPDPRDSHDRRESEPGNPRPRSTRN